MLRGGAGAGAGQLNRDGSGTRAGTHLHLYLQQQQEEVGISTDRFYFNGYLLNVCFFLLLLQMRKAMKHFFSLFFDTPNTGAEALCFRQLPSSRSSDALFLHKPSIC